MICFSSNVNKILEDIAPSSFIEVLVKVVNPIRNDMSSITNSFNGSFLENCQEKSIPLRLLSLCSLLIDGCDPHKKSASQSALTISQIITREYRKRWDNHQSTTRLHLKARETPVPIYIGLKLYTTVRSRTLIDKLFHLGICVSYARVLDICDSISSLMLEKYEKEKVFVPQMLKLNVFTIIAKSTKVSRHFHGISMTLMQFLSCLGVSHHFHGISMTLMQFLSCLGVSHHFHGISMTLMQFLSCLGVSHHFHGISMTLMQFLSCLGVSHHFHGISMTLMQFLSCWVFLTTFMVLV